MTRTYKHQELRNCLNRDQIYYYDSFRNLSKIILIFFLPLFRYIIYRILYTNIVRSIYLYIRLRANSYYWAKCPKWFTAPIDCKTLRLNALKWFILLSFFFWKCQLFHKVWIPLVATYLTGGAKENNPLQLGTIFKVFFCMCLENTITSTFL